MCAPTTFHAWLQETLDPDQIADLARYGADTAWPGLTYTADCVELYDSYADEIREALNQDAEDFGYDCPEALIATFARKDMLWSEDGRRSLLIWYLAERTAQQLAGAGQ
jgi:hypothetical protein